MHKTEPITTSWQPCFELLEPRILLDGGATSPSLTSFAAQVGSVVLQDTEGQAAVYVYGSSDATIEPWAGGQQLRVREEAAGYFDEVIGTTVYEQLVVDVMLSGPGGTLGTAGPVDLSGAERLQASVLGTAGAMLLRDADGDLFGHMTVSMPAGMIPGAHTTYDAMLDPMMWTRLSLGGDGVLDLTAITGIGVRLTNETMVMIYDSGIDAAIDGIAAVSGIEPGPMTVAFREGFDFYKGFGSLPGDANGDGIVDAADYIALERAFGSSVAQPGVPPDFDASGTVDYGDLMVLVRSYEQSIYMAFSASAHAVEAASVMPTTTGSAPYIVVGPAPAVAEPESSASLAAEAAVAMIVGLPGKLPAASSILQDNAGILDALADSGRSSQATKPSTKWLSHAEAQTRFASHLGPPSISSSRLLRTGNAGQMVADLLTLARPWRPDTSAMHELPREPLMITTALDISAKLRRDRLGAISLDVLAVTR